ncbi:MAG TPA: LptF/LptG family permease [Vicinamibacterales bacterium]|nr:LptF/LptG family permease [Vicinamibacterales bacterium]
MFRTLDRYLLREILAPFALALIVFTFILQIPPIMEQAESLIAKGVPWLTVGHLLLLLLPQALGLTIPMALLVGLLIAFGRLSADREMVATLACGISLYRFLLPVMTLATAAAGVTMWIMVVGIPDANQTFREITYDIVAARVENDVRPRVFFEDFPGRVLYVQESAAPEPGWRKVFMADTSTPGRPTLFLASRGRLLLDRQARRVELILHDGARYAVGDKPGQYETQSFDGRDVIISLDPDSVFPSAALPKGVTELRIAELREQIAVKAGQGLSPHNEVMQIHQKFSIPAACLIFGVIGIALGVTARKDGKLAGFVVGIGVIFVYWSLLIVAEAMTKGHVMPAAWSRWVPNIVLAPLAVAALIWRARWADAGLPLPWFRAPAPETTPAGAPAGPTAPPAPRPRVRVVLRVPRFWVPRPTLLDGYVARLFARVAGLAFVSLLGIFYIATFVDLSDKLFKKQATGGMLLQFFWYQTPQFVYYVIPLSVLLGALVTVGLLARTSELTVMKACGISLYRLALPLILMAIVGSLVLFSLEDRLLAHANRRAEALNARIRGHSPRTFNALNRQWIAGRGNRVYHYALFDPKARELSALSLYSLDPQRWRLTRHTFVNRATYSGAEWIGTSGWEFSFRGRSAPWQPFGRRPLDLETPDYFETEQPDAELMTYAELQRHVTDLRASGFNVVPLLVQAQRKLAFPLVTVVMTLLAVPFGATAGRRGALYGVGIAIALAMIYWLLMSAFGAVGSAGLLPPALAAWSPNLLFAAGAAYLLLTVRT